MDVVALKPSPWFLAAGLILDLLVGDPYYAAHPVRLMGWTLTRFENLLRRFGLDGYAGGILLFVLLSLLWISSVSLLVIYSPRIVRAVLEIFLIYSLLALRDLLRHGWDVEKAARREDLKEHGRPSPS